jgi:hypothetical protein
LQHQHACGEREQQRKDERRRGTHHGVRAL